MSISLQSRFIVSVPIVAPEELATAFTIVEHWVAHRRETSEPFDATDIFSVLNRVKQHLDIEPTIVVALFKRSIALLTFCAEVSLPKEAFDGRNPGKRLLIAASGTPVLQITEEDSNNTTIQFDTFELLHAFRSTLN